jgi:hypothetical protein
MFPNLDFEFRPFAQSWQVSFANDPTVSYWLSKISHVVPILQGTMIQLHRANFIAGIRLAHLGSSAESEATHLQRLLHYVTRVKHFNKCRGYSDRLEIKSRALSADNAVQYQGKKSALLRVPNHNFWYGRQEETAFQLVVFESNKCGFESSQKLRLCPCREA